MPDIVILKEAELRQAVRLDGEAISCVEAAFRLLATESVVMPPILSFHIPEHNGEVDVKTAYVPGIPSFAIKMSPGFFDNPKLGLPSLNGLMVLFSAETGLVEALLLDNGYLTDIRTAAAGAVAANWLSRPDSQVAGIVGTGVQARLQLQALTLVRPIEKALIWGRDNAKARTLAKDCATGLGIEVTATDSVSELMAAADIVVTTTPAKSPLIAAAHARPGQHITAMGSDADYKNELAPDLLRRADLYVPDRIAQCLRQGELRTAVAAGFLPGDVEPPELGEIIACKKPGRISASQITVCDLTGTGVQDTAIASFARQRAATENQGTVFSS